MVWGIIHAKSGRNKINTKKSTETEVFGISECFLYNILLIMLFSCSCQLRDVVLLTTHVITTAKVLSKCKEMGEILALEIQGISTYTIFCLR